MILSNIALKAITQYYRYSETMAEKLIISLIQE